MSRMKRKTTTDAIPLNESPYEERKADIVKQRYVDGVSYKRNQGYYEEWPEYERFWNADQWPQPTPKTRNFPRPVTNHFAAIIEQKVMGVTYERPEIYFDPLDPSPPPPVPVMSFSQQQPQAQAMPKPIDGAEALSQVAKHQWGKCNMDEINDDTCRSAALLGTGIVFTPWDNNIVGGGEGHYYIGDIAVYEVDPADFFPGNPYIPPKDMQRQPYIIVAERVPLDTVKAEYRQHSDLVDTLQPDSTLSDTRIYDQQRIEHGTGKDVDLIHQWEKVLLDEGDDEFEPIVIVDEWGNELEVPKIPQYRLDYTVVCQDKVIRYEPGIYKHGLYPFAAMQWLSRRKSFFGKSESVDLINSQKEDNRMAGIQMLGAYNTGLPNIRYKPNFVDKKDVATGPGGNIIPDNSPHGHWGVDFMQPPSPAGHIPQLRAVNVEGMKDTSGVHEAWSGKAPGARLNASAIMALQEAAGIRIRGIQRRFHRLLRDIGEIWLAHWKEFYDEQRLFKVMGENRLEGFIWFKGSDYGELQFDVRVQAGAASPFSKSLFMAHLDKLFEAGIIGPDEYLEMIPTDIFPKASWVRKKRAEKLEQAQQQMVMQQATVIEQMVDDVIQKASQAGVPITEETLQIMLQMAEQISMVQGQEGQAPPAPTTPPILSTPSTPPIPPMGGEMI